MSDNITVRSLAKMIDHSLLHPTMTDQEIISGCELALRYDVATACVKPYAIELAAEVLAGSDVQVCAVIGFPHGNSTTGIKIIEAEDAARRGATEIDMVVNIGRVLGGNWGYVSNEITAVNEAVISKGAGLKVIFENDYLANNHIERLCSICSEHRVAFIKTSSGYGFVKQANGMYQYRGATDEHLALMRRHASPEVHIKGAGGIRTLDDLLRVRKLGVTRIGATATAQIIDDARKRGISES